MPIDGKCSIYKPDNLNGGDPRRRREFLGLQLVVLPLRNGFLRLPSLLFIVGALTLADKTTALLPLDAASDTDGFVEDEAPEDVRPRGVVGQVGVELAGDGVELVEAGPGDGGEVVVLVVEADVVGEEVEGPVVRVGLGHGEAVGRVGLGRGHGRVDVVLGDEVARQRVQAAGEERRQDEVEQGFAAQGAQDDGVEGHLRGYVEGRDPGERHAVDDHGP